MSPPATRRLLGGPACAPSRSPRPTSALPPRSSASLLHPLGKTPWGVSPWQPPRPFLSPHCLLQQPLISHPNLVNYLNAPFAPSSASLTETVLFRDRADFLLVGSGLRTALGHRAWTRALLEGGFCPGKAQPRRSNPLPSARLLLPKGVSLNSNRRSAVICFSLNSLKLSIRLLCSPSSW